MRLRVCIDLYAVAVPFFFLLFLCVWWHAHRRVYIYIRPRARVHRDGASMRGRPVGDAAFGERGACVPGPLHMNITVFASTGTPTYCVDINFRIIPVVDTRSPFPYRLVQIERPKLCPRLMTNAIPNQYAQI